MENYFEVFLTSKNQIINLNYLNIEFNPSNATNPYKYDITSHPIGINFA